MSHDGCVALPRGVMCLSAVCDCGISWSFSLTIFENIFKYKIWGFSVSFECMIFLLVFKEV